MYLFVVRRSRRPGLTVKWRSSDEPVLNADHTDTCNDGTRHHMHKTESVSGSMEGDATRR